MGVEQYRELFVTESDEHLQIINSAILRLEKDPDNMEILNEIFRSAHTLKGMSATMGFENLTKLTHKMEDVLDIFRSQKIPVGSEVVDTLFGCLDMLEMLIEEIKTKKNLNLDISAMVVQLESIIPTVASIQSRNILREKKAITLTKMEKQNLSDTIKDQKFKIFNIDIYLSADCQLKSVRAFMVFSRLGELGEVVKSQPPIKDLEENKFGQMFTVLLLTKVPKKDIENALTQVMEVDRVEFKAIKDINSLASEQEVSELEASAGVPTKKEQDSQIKTLAQQIGFKKIQSIRVSTKRLDNLMNFIGELVIAKIRLMQIAQSQQIRPLDEILKNIDRLTSDLQDEVMQARLIPIAQVFDRFPRMIRDLARSKGKQINLEISGGDIELDRTVLDEIANPLVHLLRNSVDHGIELPQKRKSCGKKPVGLVRLDAYREKTSVIIKVSDDGKGMDPNLLREIALRKEFLTEEQVGQLNDAEILKVITLPGFSSISEITDTSGRGVGMDVVKRKMEELGGSLSFDSQLDKGSSFSLKLPITVAIIKAMLVKINDEIYATPIANIAETVKITKDKIKRVEKFEVMKLRNEVLPLVRLKKILGENNGRGRSRENAFENSQISIVVVEGSGTRAGLIVDELLGQQEVVIKSLGNYLKGIKGFAGATILGDGRVALILDVATLIGQH